MGCEGFRTGAAWGGAAQLWAASSSKATHWPAGIRRIDIHRPQYLQEREYELLMKSRFTQKAAWCDFDFAGGPEITDHQVGRCASERDIKKLPLIFDRRPP